MNALKPFEIPIAGLQVGLHPFHFDIDNKFFKCFESSYDKGQFSVDIDFDKKHSMFEVHFSIQGLLGVECDRCMEDIMLPLEVNRSLIFKFSEEPREEEEIVYIDSNASVLNLSKYIYEFILLSVPLKKVKDCASEEYKDCNQKILAYLSEEEEIIEEEPESELAKALRNININKKK